MVTMAGVGVAISGTVLEILQRAGLSTGAAIDLVFVVLAAALLPAGLVVIIARERGRADAIPAGHAVKRGHLAEAAVRGALGRGAVVTETSRLTVSAKSTETGQ
jgi:hypothetical protein